MTGFMDFNNMISVEEYTTKFYNLSICMGLNEIDEQLITKYVSGLKISIQDEMRIVRLSNLDDAYQHALMAKQHVLRYGQRWLVSKCFNNTSNQQEVLKFFSENQ